MNRTSSFVEAAAIALQSLRASKLRSFLTLLGIILATATLVAVMSIIHGMDVYIAQNGSDMGADGFRVVRMAFIGDWDAKKYLELEKKNPQLNKDEYQFLKSKITLSRDIGLSTRRRINVTFGSDTMSDVQLQGASANIAMMTNLQPTAGRFLTDSENQNRMAVAFIGSDLKERFFPRTDPVGKEIRVDGRPYTVIGVARALGNIFGQSRDAFVMIPIDTYFKSYGSRSGMSYLFNAIDQSYLFRAQDEVKVLLRSYRGLKPKEDDTFAIISSDSLVGAWNRMTAAIAATSVAVVSVFMLVGGVVIMNIMLAVVTERTHEIGIRKSVGARSGDILQQFLVESSVLSAMGGLIGVLIAWLVAVLVNAVTPVPMSVPASAVLIAVTISSLTGLFFGIYPAHLASKLDPIEALRVER